MKIKKSYVILSIPAIIIIAALIFIVSTSVEENETIITGIIETTEVDM